MRLAPVMVTKRQPSDRAFHTASPLLAGVRRLRPRGRSMFLSIRDFQFHRDVQPEKQALTADVVADVVEGIRRQPRFPHCLWRRFYLELEQADLAADRFWFCARCQ